MAGLEAGAVGVGGHAVAAAEALVEVAQVFEAALQGDFEDFFLSGGDLGGGPMEAGVLDQVARTAAEVAATGAGGVFVAAPGQADEAGDTTGEFWITAELVDGFGQPAGRADGGGALAGEVGKDGDDAGQEAFRGQAIVSPGGQVGRQDTEALEGGGAELEFAPGDVRQVEEPAGDEGLAAAQGMPEGGAESEVEELHTGAAGGGAEGVGIAGADEQEGAGGYGAGGAIDPVDAGAPSDPEQFVMVVVVGFGRIGIAVVPEGEGGGVVGHPIAVGQAAHQASVN